MSRNGDSESLKCSQWVRSIPLERFRLPKDGRKWRQAARSRSDLLLRLSTYANGDGTFVRDGKNYSPSEKTVTKHVSEKTYYRLTDALHELALLSWTRTDHYERRVYTIHLENIEKSPVTFSEETPVRFGNDHLSDSEKTPVTATESPVTLEKNTCHSDSNHLSHSPKSPVTMGDIPSLPTLPSNQPSIPSGLAGGMAGNPKGQPLTTATINCDIDPSIDYSRLTESVLLDALRVTHQEEWNKLSDKESEKIPRALPSTKAVNKKLVAAVGEYYFIKASLADLGDGFKDWWKARYKPSFDEEHPICQPLAVFANEFKEYCGNGNIADPIRCLLEDFQSGDYEHLHPCSVCRKPTFETVWFLDRQGQSNPSKYYCADHFPYTDEKRAA